MKIQVIQQEFSGIPEQPELFLSEQEANARYVFLVNENVDMPRKCQNIDEAMNAMSDGDETCFIPEKWYMRYWELSVDNKVLDVLEKLVFVINKDKDGDYFICKEAEEIVQLATRVAGGV